MTTISPIFQVTKIQMRQGIASTLPGAPITLVPLTFATGLDIGEIGFTTDTNRLFIGSSSAIGHQVNYQRTVFPYQNIEILTESSPIIPQVVGEAFKYLSSYGFYSVSLPTAATWATVAGAPALQGEICAKMEYFAFNSAGAPLRQGTQRIIALAGASQAAIIDDSISAPSAFVSATPTPPSTPSLTTTFGFQFIRNGSNFTMQYINNLPTTIRLFFSFASPRP